MGPEDYERKSVPDADFEVLNMAIAVRCYVDLPSGVCVADIFVLNRELDGV